MDKTLKWKKHLKWKNIKMEKKTLKWKNIKMEKNIKM